MSTEELRVRVAKALGKPTECPECKGAGLVGFGEYRTDCGCNFGGNIWWMDDWPEDLNACHELEEGLTDEELVAYDVALKNILREDNPAPSSSKVPTIWHLTAEQRCRAFVRVKEGK